MSDKQTPDRKGASPSAPRRVEKVNVEEPALTRTRHSGRS